MKVIFEEKNENQEIFDKILKLALESEKQTNDKIVVYCSFVSKDEIQKINKEQRGVDSVTDVLSFPMLENKCNMPIDEEHFPFDVDPETNEISLGDIVICTDKAKEQAEEFGHSFNRELSYLFTHAVFHLLGYDHMTEEDKVVMRKKEEEVLNKLGITRED